MKKVLLALAGAFFLYTAWSAVTLVRPGERAVVRRFGKIVATPGPGLFLGLPWGMDRVDRVALAFERRINVGNPLREDDDPARPSVPEGQLLTGDHNLVNMQVVVNYSVIDQEVENFVLQGDQAEALIARTAENALAEWVSGRTVDEVLGRGKAVIPFWLVGELNRRLGDYRLGVRIKSASVPLLEAPQEVKADFEEVSRAQTEIQTKINKAEGEAKGKVRDAAAEVARLQSSARAYETEQKLQARAEAANFLKQLHQYRELGKQNPYYLAGIWWTEMSRIFTRMSQNGRLDVLDNYLGPDGLDITQVPLMRKKK